MSVTGASQQRDRDKMIGFQDRPQQKCTVLFAVLLVLLGGGGGAAQQGAETIGNRAASSTSTDWTASTSYRIGPGDVLDIRMLNKPQLSRDLVRVDENGMIMLPLIGEVRAGCKTEKELAREISTLYIEYQKNPQVDVFVREYQSQAVAVIGAVRTPGRFQMQRRVRLLEMLSFVGGPSERAGRTLQVVHSSTGMRACIDSSAKSELLRTADSGPEEGVVAYDLRETLKGAEQSNPYVQAGDIITILEADQVYVVGNVLRPSSLQLTEPLNVSRAIAMAGGLMPDTKSERVRIVRQLPGGGGKQEIIVDLKAIDKRRAEDVLLQANDIVDVPTSGTKRFFRDLLSIVAPTVGSLPVRVIR
jgi:polysaccharide export outer membrane protein